MEINWDILKPSVIGALPPVDVAGNVQAGFQMSQQMIEKARVKSALAAYATDPADPAVQNALAAVSPQFAMNLGEQRYKLAERDADRARYGAVLSAYDTDPNAGRRAAIQTGDPDLIKTIRELGEADRDRLGKFHEAAAPHAYKLRQMPPGPERLAYFEQVKPLLATAGADPNTLAQFDPNNDGLLDAFITRGQTVAQLVSADQTKAFNVGPGEGRYTMDKDGNIVTLIAPNSGDAQFGAPVAGPASGTPSIVTDQASYDAVPPGGTYAGPDGKVRRKPGGQTAQPSGNFPS